MSVSHRSNSGVFSEFASLRVGGALQDLNDDGYGGIVNGVSSPNNLESKSSETPTQAVPGVDHLVLTTWEDGGKLCSELYLNDRLIGEVDRWDSLRDIDNLTLRIGSMYNPRPWVGLSIACL